MKDSTRAALEKAAVAVLNVLGKAAQERLQSKNAANRSQSSKPKPKAKAKASSKPKTKPASKSAAPSKPAPKSASKKSPPLSSHYPGDFTGKGVIEYAPDLDGVPDPGEVVWTWVPYEEDFTQGKDRPVLLIGHDGDWLLGLMLSSKDHDQDAADEARYGRFWIDVGSGKWDSKGRPSEARLDRILRVNPNDVRREGAILAKKTFAEVKRSLFTTNGW